LTWPIKQFKKTVRLNVTFQRKHGQLFLKKKEKKRMRKNELDAKKRAGSRKGKQFVPNTEAAKKAGKAARAAKMHKDKGSKG
jgi:hypothetical protein